MDILKSILLIIIIVILFFIISCFNCPRINNENFTEVNYDKYGEKVNYLLKNLVVFILDNQEIKNNYDSLNNLNLDKFTIIINTNNPNNKKIENPTSKQTQVKDILNELKSYIKTGETNINVKDPDIIENFNEMVEDTKKEQSQDILEKILNNASMISEIVNENKSLQEKETISLIQLLNNDESVLNLKLPNSYGNAKIYINKKEVYPQYSSATPKENNRYAITYDGENIKFYLNEKNILTKKENIKFNKINLNNNSIMVFDKELSPKEISYFQYQNVVKEEIEKNNQKLNQENVENKEDNNQENDNQKLNQEDVENKEDNSQENNNQELNQENVENKKDNSQENNQEDKDYIYKYYPIWHYTFEKDG